MRRSHENVEIVIGPITSTGHACSQEIMQQEQGYLSGLQSSSSYTINGSTLTLSTANGALVFGAAVAVPAPVPVAAQ